MLIVGGFFCARRPIVEEICLGRTVEVKELENVLDGLCYVLQRNV